MSAKRPRPAIPVLVHVDNPAEVGSVTVDVSTIEGKMDTVINNQERIYDKIPTSSGGSSADLTTVNANTTALAETIGSVSSTISDGNLLGNVKNLVATIGNFNSKPTPNGTTIRSLLYNVRDAVGGAANTPTATETTVRGLLTATKENTTALAEAIGPASSASSDNNLLGYVRNLHFAVGDTATIPSTSDTSVRGLLTALKVLIGPANSTAADSNLLGGVKNIVGTLGSSNGGIFLKDKTVRALLYNLREGIGNAENSPTATETTVRGLLTAIKENTASGGGGGSADLTTVNEKTTALAAAIGSASDDSSTVSVIGLLKSITDKY